ncbi:putative sulfate exporter family transporter [Phytoactinopolyspora halotolerans]|uniref:Putative sulfate exporter family transporter n=2 Tax=Phytoactinopolyspora halotolerans TaxID=1981512 RepID=A0A6L9SAD8_9ACTN|nr:putative sulfate exporter family transporter [Phytoactinopolyspora halotolerans]
MPGLAVVAGAVAVAYGVSMVSPALGPLTGAVMLGILARNLGLLWPAAEPGVAFAAKRMLRAGVVLLGLKLAIPELVQLRPVTLVIIVTTVVVTFVGTRWIGRRLGLGDDRALLLATGSAICGASAIAAMSSVVDGEDDDTATAVAMVTLYGSLAMALYPGLQGPLGLSHEEYGIWVGASVHEVAQVVAAATVVAEPALLVAVVAKLARVVLLAPLVAAVAVVRQRDGTPDGRRPLIPAFVLGFLGMMLLRSADVVPSSALSVADTASTLLLAAAMFGLGAGVRLAALARTGGRALLAGAAATVIAATTAYAGLLVARM